ncbi:MAG TPA: helix-turn-helix transcriptional regulator [Marinobacter sp.]|nr:helix-turn-helix transcriptional regulator [Marinobacter sp.]
MSPDIHFSAPALNPDTSEAIYALWDQLAAFPASETRASLDHVLDGVGRLIDAHHAIWFSMIRLQEKSPDDPMLGWRMGPFHSFRELPLDMDLYKQEAKKVDMGKPTPCMVSNIKLAGNFRASIIRERMSEGYIESSYFKATHTARGVRDSIAVVSSLNADTEVYCVFYRLLDQSNFNRTDLAIASSALRGLNWFQRRVMLSYGLSLADKPLTRTERRVTRHLLTDMPEKQIAERLDQSHATTHKHINSIYRKFNVNSRSALMAIWLGERN